MLRWSLQRSGKSVSRLPLCRIQAVSSRSQSQQGPTGESTTHFGFRAVPEKEKEALVGQVFSNVAQRYDVMNDAMSFGIHRLWKDTFIKRLSPAPNTRLLDVAGGTGDISQRFLDHCQSVHGDSKAHVTMVDINPDMLAEGQRRFADSSYVKNGQVDFQVSNAEKLEGIADHSMDAYTIAFGIRNCTHIDRVLSEAYRVLKPGGRFMCLEFGRVNNPLLSTIYDAYSFQAIPVLGHLIAADFESYQYLVESIRKFPPQPEFAEMIRAAGFYTPAPAWEDLSFGVAAIHSGFKL